MEKVFNAETLTVKGWEGFTTQQIGDALEKAIAEKEKMGFRVKKDCLWKCNYRPS